MADKDKYADEMLSDDELDLVAGGTYAQTTEDSEFLKGFGLFDSYFSDELNFFPTARKKLFNERVKDSWAKVGVTLEYNDTEQNKYYMNGNEISREAAYQHVFIESIKEVFRK